MPPNHNLLCHAKKTILFRFTELAMLLPPKDATGGATDSCMTTPRMSDAIRLGAHFSDATTGTGGWLAAAAGGVPEIDEL